MSTIRNIALIHGWGSDSCCWEPLLDAMGTVAQAVHRIDLPGFGECASQPWPQTEQLLAELETQLPEDCLLLGWSLGGMLAVQLAARSRKVRALVTIAANACFSERDQWPGMPPAVFDNFCVSQQQQPEKNWQRFCGLQARGDREMRSLLKTLKSWQPAEFPTSWNRSLTCLGEIDNRHLLPALKIPALHIFGEQDALVPAVAAQQLHELKCPVTIMQGAGHCPHLSRPADVAALVKGILEDGESVPLDKSAVARAFGRAAQSYDAAAHLQRAVCRELLGRVDGHCNPKRILDLGSGTGYGSALLRKRFPDAEIIALDLAPGMLAFARENRPQADNYIAADAEQLPLRDGCIDLVFSSFALQWCYNLPQLFAEVRRVLSAGAQVLISTLVPGTLQELEESWSAVDGNVHVNRFLPASDWQQACADHQLGGLLQTEQRVLHFDAVTTLMRELKSIGAHNVNRAAGKGLLSRARLRQLTEAYENKRTGAGLPATYQVLYLNLNPSDNGASAHPVFTGTHAATGSDPV
ncbi:malonyl-ACP O-methyltransferase BioC [Microbulbifer mangrovi]|uniref:malonyl-ACP O-methyltransferase BioC n=1 Tax=Microbulbifer mangrovi TaxID=927787 RepID=UPI000990434B|nr:malonyl-ACP O-methyltransferase BioC [Microbulbifer mangrovi]